jgi:hypothetical protein
MTYQLLDAVESGKDIGFMILIKQKGKKPAMLCETKDSYIAASYQTILVIADKKEARIVARDYIKRNG